ncbi:hypothetical protein [Nocardiopsis sp. ATB16-24]|uniref:hypothetical protein n=1 Tax=Nocardiopsis sp. ATB16-24 TaxID=3019555 RepID=UPI002556B495|nr:hypothetical protein [Nocardiopsis sp. ATB16-24]
MNSTESALSRQWHTLLTERAPEVPELAEAVRSGLSVASPYNPEVPLPISPVLLSRRTADEVAHAGREVVRLAVEECMRRTSSPRRLAHLLGIEPSPLLSERESYNRWAASQARPDIVVSQGVPKVLECNIGSAIGGIEDLARLDPLLWGSSAAEKFRREHGVRSGRTVQARRELLTRIARDRGALGRLRMGIAGHSEATFAEVVEDAAAHGIDAFFVELEDLTEDGGLRRGSEPPMDLFLQKFIAAGAYRDGEPMAALEAAVDRDSTFVANPDLSSLFSSKTVLAWLTSSAEDLPERDRRTIQRHVPWTAELQDSRVVYKGVRQELLPLVLRDREELVLKPVDGFGGHGVVVGRTTGEAEWAAAVDDCLKERYIVQVYTHPDTFSLSCWHGPSATHELLDTAAVISPFVIDGQVTGYLARTGSLIGSGGVISAETGALASVFVVD